MLKYGTRDQSGKKHKVRNGIMHPVKTINALSNEDIVSKPRFRPREYSKVERVLAKRGLAWATT